MIVLRKPPYDSFVSYTLEPLTEYSVTVRYHDRNVVFYQDLITSTTAGVVALSWNGTYGDDDTPYDFKLYDETYHVEITADGETVVEDNITVERPYVDPATLGTTATEIATATENESLARAIIDSITGGFYFKTSWIETTGQGTDYLSVWERAYKILKVYENSELVYDTSLDTPALGSWNYLITKDKTAITKDPIYLIGEFNRAESTPVGLAIAASDSISMFDTSDSGNTLSLRPGVLFNNGADYIIKLETGYKVVPYDIQDATKMLVHDIACGKLEYFKRYITDYSTDQFKIKIDSSSLAGTGNMLVDKILDKYVTNIGKPGLI